MASVLCTALAPSVFAAPTDVEERSKGLREPAILTFQAVAIPAEDAGLTKLYKQRYNAVGAELRDLSLLYRGGKVRFPEVASAVERYADAGKALGTTTEQRIKQLRLAQDVAIWLERIVRDKFENEVEPANVMRRAEALRTEIDILIQKEHDSAKAGTATEQ
jgi:hypothetical protein